MRHAVVQAQRVQVIHLRVHTLTTLAHSSIYTCTHTQAYTWPGPGGSVGPLLGVTNSYCLILDSSLARWTFTPHLNRNLVENAKQPTSLTYPLNYRL